MNGTNICVIGLGYVGLPLAVSFGNHFNTVGFDIDRDRISDLKHKKFDKSGEVSSKDIRSSKNLTFTSDKSSVVKCNYYIVTVPTPIYKNNKPDCRSLCNACRLVGSVLKEHDTVVFESTVYPGATENLCVPILEKESALELNRTFSVGYSPERINVGDKSHKLENIIKITSGSNHLAGLKIDELYKKIIDAGTLLVSSIKIAEAAKVIENTQRDLNIALVNELSIIFAKMQIDTSQVLEAAETKWNFMKFRPGLVGGHCIGVDPYYLTYAAESLGYTPEVILSGRKVNDGMSTYVAKNLVEKIKSRFKKNKRYKILIMGLTFKENCSDIRNSKVVDVIKKLKSMHASIVDVYDPHVDKSKALKEYNLKIDDNLRNRNYDGIIIAVGHDNFRKMGPKMILDNGRKNCVLFDLKGIFPREDSDIRL